MRFRTKLLLACLPLALAPLVFFGLWARGEVSARIAGQYGERVAALADVIEDDLERESAVIAARLDRLAESVATDNRLRLAIVDPDGAERAYLLDWAADAMPVAGLDVLRLHDADGRVLSSGHFRQEYDAVDPASPAALSRAEPRAALVELPTPAGSVLVLARGRSVRVGTRTVTLVGGTAVDDRFLERLARGTGLDVRLRLPEGYAPAGAAELRTRAGDRAGAMTDDRLPDLAAAHAREVAVSFAAGSAGGTARFVVRAPTGPLDALLRDMDRWLAAALAAAAALALLLAFAVPSRLARPLAELARKAGRVDLDRLDVDFPTRRADEVGDLARVLDRMTRRLRASAARLRDAERRATIGDIARQVNHDVRNGLIPIRNVLGHLAQLARERPAELSAVFLERQPTLDSSVDYLDALARNYARLSPRLERRPCDLGAIVERVVADVSPRAPGDAGGGGDAGGRGDARVVTDLARGLPPVHADPVALRRIVENLVVNGLESLEGGSGRVRVWTRASDDDGDPRILCGVEDDGRGMTAEERARAFDDFYTTKPDGGGLGLSIVRRLVADLGGRIAVASEPGSGTRFTIELPAAAPESGGRGRAPASAGAVPRAEPPKEPATEPAAARPERGRPA